MVSVRGMTSPNAAVNMTCAVQGDDDALKNIDKALDGDNIARIVGVNYSDKRYSTNARQ